MNERFAASGKATLGGPVEIPVRLLAKVASVVHSVRTIENWGVCTFATSTESLRAVS